MTKKINILFGMSVMVIKDEELDELPELKNYLSICTDCRPFINHSTYFQVKSGSPYSVHIRGLAHEASQLFDVQIEEVESVDFFRRKEDKLEA